jgi:hypothetical protein
MALVKGRELCPEASPRKVALFLLRALVDPDEATVFDELDEWVDGEGEAAEAEDEIPVEINEAMEPMEAMDPSEPMLNGK